MELVYLWVEDYKNIKRQGFNFSPRFRCEYDEDKNELTIDENDDYIPDFFGKNINVTAIIGKNGSGKSSLLNAIIDSNEDHAVKPKNYILVFFENEQLYYINNSNKIDFSCIESLNYLEKLDKKIIVYIDRKDNDDLPIDMGNTTHSESSKHVWTNYHEIDISQKTIIGLLAIEIGKVDSSFKLSSFMYLPTKITIKLKTPKELIGKFIRFTASNRQEIENYFLSLSDIEYQLLLIAYIERCGFRLSAKNTNINELLTKDNISKELTEEEVKKIQVIYELSNNPKTEVEINSLTEKEKDLFIRKNGYYNFLTFDLIDEKERHYNDLSYGEQNLFGQLLNIYFYLTNKDDNFIFLFDEPEISLHPAWQKQYINEVITLFKNMKSKSHFMFTSHSPFLLSDIPKQNIIFLDKDEKGNCKVVDGLKEKKQTFGANIHTLLSDSFFMEDGLMGEFAKSKIDRAIKLLNQKYLNEDDLKYCEQIISIIGEPIVKNQLEKMLHYKKVDYLAKDTREEIEFLKHRIDLLSKRL